MCPSGWKTSAQTFESCACESAARGPAGMLSVVVPVEDRAFGTAGGEDRMDWVEWNGGLLPGICDGCNIFQYVQQTSFLCPFSMRYSFMARMSNIRTV